MTNASLARKLARLSGAQRPPSGLALNSRLGALMASDDFNPRDLLAEEQDRRRESLAERLLEIFAEGASIHNFTDSHAKETNGSGESAFTTEAASLTVSEWGVKLAHAALAAATVLYPEVPAEGAEPLVPLPADALEGARSVAPES